MYGTGRQQVCSWVWARTTPVLLNLRVVCLSLSLVVLCSGVDERCCTRSGTRKAGLPNCQNVMLPAKQSVYNIKAPPDFRSLDQSLHRTMHACHLQKRHEKPLLEELPGHVAT